MNRVARGVDAHLIWHMCYGNARELDCLYPEVNASYIEQLLSGEQVDWDEIHLETARPGMEEMKLLSRWVERDNKYLGIGVIEVMNQHVESPDEVAGRIRCALDHVAAERLVISTDCGLYQLAHDVAFRKLCALVEGVNIVRTEVGS